MRATQTPQVEQAVRARSSATARRAATSILSRGQRTLPFLVALALLASALPLLAVVQPERSPALEGKEFRDSHLQIFDNYQSADSLIGSDHSTTLATSNTTLQAALQDLGVSAEHAFFDRRSGRWATLILRHSLLPGSGNGNNLSWESLGATAPTDTKELRERAWQAIVSYLESHQGSLGIDTAELTQPGRLTLHQDGSLIQIHGARTIDGVEVRKSYFLAIVKEGNMILFGTRNWGDRRTSAQPSIDLEAAGAAVRSHLAPLFVGEEWLKPHLAYLPVALDSEEPGEGIELRLVWVLRPGRSPIAALGGEDLSNFEALVDAHTGTLLAFADTRHYGAASARNVAGGIYPVSNDGIGADGTEQAGYPMPAADIAFGAENYVTDTGGNVLACLDGDITSDLTGPYVTIADNCGAVNLASAGDIDFGTSGGDDCTTPGTGGAGNTHSSRTGFFELNRLIESAQAQLPDNLWLQQSLTSNMNINQTCNAFWGGGSVNFYRSGGGCGNTGEIAAIFDHEWGHGIDDNDTNGFISDPGEAIADIYATLRLNIACIGRGFLQAGSCGGYGDACTSGCSGVRDIDFANHASGAAHTIANYVLDTMATPNGGCQGFGSQFGPCGGETHCEGMIGAETGFDLIHRDLPAAGFDSNAALEIATRIIYLGAGTLGNWYTCAGAGNDGCNADGGYLNFLAADDDNGDLLDGTPHMEAIFGAFDRHGIGCNTPTVQDGGCSGVPTVAPSVVATPLDRGTRLTWGAVAGATWYNIYRTDGVHACDFGKTLVGTTSSLEWVDAGLQNGRAYSYVVLGGNGTQGGTCMGPASSCTAVTPAPGPNPVVDPNSLAFSFANGDGDDFVDNCEETTVTFDYSNLGSSLTNPTITSVVSSSHPALNSSITFSPSLGASLATCASGQGSFTFTAAGLSFNESVHFIIGLSGDELAGVSRFTEIWIFNTESDLDFQASKTFTFEADAEGWEVQQGIFGRTGTGGAQATTFFEDSSDAIADQCDQIRSPGVILSPTSTLSLWTNFDIEVFSAGTWYDRANIGVVDASGARTAINPDGGRLYNADSNGVGNYSGCNDPEEGWAGLADTWAESTFSATALGSAALAGQTIALDVVYGTDPAEQRRGFWFDQVTLTNFSLQIPDAQSNSCVAIFADGFESNDTSAWSNTVGGN